MLGSIYGSTGVITVFEILLCTGVSLVLGVVIAFVYMFRSTYSKNFVFTLALLPALVQAVIMLVNGNLGTSIAVMGAFGLVRFRSAPGSAREISSLFFAMAVGLAAGMGFIVYAIAFTLIISAMMVLYTAIGLGERDPSVKSLKVVIPENMEYAHLFDDLFDRYTRSFSLDKARSTNLGGLFELQYTIVLKDNDLEKQMLDEIRQRNANLTVSCGRVSASRDEL